MTKKTYLGIDHVVIRTHDSQLFELLSGPLCLPVTWPLQTAAFATFGWIGVGNTSLEIWAAAENSDLPADCPLPCIQQIAFAPEHLAASLACLEAEGLQCKPPRTFESKNEQGESRTNFTNAVILDLSSEACCVFFCDWDPHAPIVPWSKGMTPLERRQSGQHALSACNGGALGVVGLRQIAVQTKTLTTSAQKWAALTQTKRSPFLLSDGIELHLSAGSRDAISSLTFAVRDLTAATEFLRSKDLANGVQEQMLSLECAETEGIALRFIQA